MIKLASTNLASRQCHKRGDTLVEVMFAVGVFGLAAVGAIALMNRGLATAQGSLEITMARQEIDTQAETLRFIHDAYISEKETDAEKQDGWPHCGSITSYRELWKCITKQAYASGTFDNDAGKAFFTPNVQLGATCNSVFSYDGSGSFNIPSKSFVVNPRVLGSGESLTKALVSASTAGVFRISGTYPRLLYGTNADDEALSDVTIEDGAPVLPSVNTISNAEGVWVTAIASKSTVDGQPEYYDFKIQTCWDSIANGSAATISSTVRLFNPGNS